MSLSRRLYGPGFADWDFSLAGSVTDFLIVLVSIITVIIARTSQEGTANPALRSFIVFGIFLALAFLGGGTTHMYLYILHRNGDTMGFQWGAANSAWMYAWILTSLAGISSASIPEMALDLTYYAETRYAAWIKIGLYSLGSIVTGYEAYLVFSANTGSTGTVNAYFAVAMGLLGLVVVSINICQQGRSNAKNLAAAGAGVYFFSFVFLAFLVPASCKQMGAEREGCPYPEDFNQNAIFHIITMVSVGFLFVAAQQATKDAGFKPLSVVQPLSTP